VRWKLAADGRDISRFVSPLAWGICTLTHWVLPAGTVMLTMRIENRSPD